MIEAVERFLQLLVRGRGICTVSSHDRSHQVSCRTTSLVDEFSILTWRLGKILAVVLLSGDFDDLAFDK